MNIYGIDIGNKNTRICLLSHSGFKIPSIISFDCINTRRYFGEEALDHIISCHKDTILNINLKLLNYNKSDSYVKQIKYNNKIFKLNSIELYVMYINHIYSLIANRYHISAKRDSRLPQLYIISYPDFYNNDNLQLLYKCYNSSYFNNKQFRLLPESVAIGLEYGLYKSKKGEFKNKRNVLFIDIGHINISFYILAYINDSMYIERTWTLENTGADYLDKELLKYIIHKLQISNSIPDKVDDKVLKKILIQCETVRKNLNMYNETSLYCDNIYNNDSNLKNILLNY